MMELKILREKALSDCPPEKAFWCCNGFVCRNLYELIRVIKGQNQLAFRYHVNQDNNKNDYAKWIRETMDDQELAQRLQGILDKDLYVDIIEQRIKELESC